MNNTLCVIVKCTIVAIVLVTQSTKSKQKDSLNESSK